MSATLGQQEAKHVAVEVLTNYVQAVIADMDAIDEVSVNEASHELGEDDRRLVAEYVNTARCLITASWED